MLLFKIYLSQTNPSKRNSKLKIKTSLNVLDIICPPQEPTSVGHCHYKEVELDDRFSTLHIVLETHTIESMHKFTTSFVLFISISSYRRRGIELEPILQLKA